MEENFFKRVFKDRYNIIIMLLLLAGAAIIYKLVDLQIINGNQYFEDSQYKLLMNKKIMAARGNIFDRNGVPIAINRVGFNVQIVNARLKEAELNSMLLDLCKILEKNGDNYYNSFSKYVTYDPLDFGSEAKKSQERLEKWIKDNYIKIEITGSIDIKVLFKALRERYGIDKKYTDEEAYKIMVMRYEVRNYTSLNSVLLAKDVSTESVAEIEERHHIFRGVTTDIEYMREYINANLASHVIGYVRGIDADTYNKLKNEGYSINDIIGKTGIEYSAEKELRGTPGTKKVEVDTRGRLTRVIEETPAIPGNNVVLTLDMNLQKIATGILEKRIKEIRLLNGLYHFHDAFAGAVVAIDVNNGEVLAMASYPGYDPSIFLAGPENKEAQQAIMDLNDPSQKEITSEYNRAISGRYAPGSTFKPLIGIAALEEGVITPSTVIYDKGYVTYDGMRFTCMDWRNGKGAHGAITLSHALATSCNIFFHEAGVMTGIDNIDKWAAYFGLGVKTGIELPGEIEGIRSNKEYKKQVSPYIWGKADTASSSIGQLYHEFTPLQLANYVATIANGGIKYKPHLIKCITKCDGKILKETEIEYEQIPVKEETMEAVKKGMVAVANSVDGTAVNVFKDLPFKVGAKTGTAEAYREGQSNNGVFICYAPAELDKTPQIAVAVVIEHGVYGMYAAPIAREIISEYLELNSQSVDGIESAPAVPVFVP
ncbi:MAG TPA: penicillin-binding protein 2 [Clostridiales bacterium]|nr:penicillin-binding protein 2 [Clostridiales bacterium]